VICLLQAYLLNQHTYKFQVTDRSTVNQLSRPTSTANVAWYAFDRICVADCLCLTFESLNLKISFVTHKYVFGMSRLISVHSVGQISDLSNKK